LSISYGIVEAHGGQLSVERTGPEGTTFRIDLPVAQVPAKQEGSRL
jgi:signal transduction histidine kinase